MKKQTRLPMVLSICLTFGIGLFGCGNKNLPTASAFPIVLVEQTVSVAGGGGGANVAFSGDKGWRIRITLTAASTGVIPYGFLESQPGTGEYQPPQETASEGKNSVEVTLPQMGAYTLTVFDAVNQGGAVAVKVERLS